MLSNSYFLLRIDIKGEELRISSLLKSSYHPGKTWCGIKKSLSYLMCSYKVIKCVVRNSNRNKFEISTDFFPKKHKIFNFKCALYWCRIFYDIYTALYYIFQLYRVFMMIFATIRSDLTLWKSNDFQMYSFTFRSDLWKLVKVNPEHNYQFSPFCRITKV